MLSSGLSKYNAIITQLFTATAAFLGTFIGFVVGDILYKSFQDGLLAVTCGGFVYLATCVVLQSVIKDETMHVHGDTDEKSNIVEHNKFISIQQIVGDSLGFMAGVGMMVVVAVMETH